MWYKSLIRNSIFDGSDEVARVLTEEFFSNCKAKIGINPRRLVVGISAGLRMVHAAPMDFNCS